MVSIPRDPSVDEVHELSDARQGAEDSKEFPGVGSCSQGITCGAAARTAVSVSPDPLNGIHALPLSQAEGVQVCALRGNDVYVRADQSANVSDCPTAEAAIAVIDEDPAGAWRRLGHGGWCRSVRVR